MFALLPVSLYLGHCPKACIAETKYELCLLQHVGRVYQRQYHLCLLDRADIALLAAIGLVEGLSTGQHSRPPISRHQESIISRLSTKHHQKSERAEPPAALPAECILYVHVGS